MNWLAFISILSAAMAVSFGAIGPALAEGRAVASAMDAIARQPESAGTISRTLFVGLAMIETMAIYCLVIGLILSLAGLVAPIPLMALDLLTGAVQAYIFAVLAMVFVAGAVAEAAPESQSQERTPS